MLEVGWVVVPQRQGQGIATEAARAVLQWCFERLAVESIGSLIRPDNLASARVAEKLGARRDRRLDDFFGGPTDLWLHRGSS